VPWVQQHDVHSRGSYERNHSVSESCLYFEWRPGMCRPCEGTTVSSSDEATCAGGFLASEPGAP